MLYGCDEWGKSLQHLDMLIKHDLKGNLKWMSTELDKNEVTMYFYGLFLYKVLIYITGLFYVWIVQNLCSYKLKHIVLVMHVSVISTGDMVNLGNFC